MSNEKELALQALIKAQAKVIDLLDNPNPTAEPKKESTTEQRNSAEFLTE